MNIFLNNQIQRNRTLLDIMFGRTAQNTKTHKNMQTGRRDTVTISSEAQELSMKKSISGRMRNTSIDSTIDLQKYVDAARESNSAALENAGNEIDVNAVPYTDNSTAFRAALTDKYSRLAAEAKTHSNPEEYIYGKYYDKGSQYYETNLTETERRIAYNYEMQMYKDGKINGVNYQDSLFRGIEINGDVVDNDRIMFKRQTVNRQISNILSGAGIDTAGIPDTCTFTVDPYSYYISVDGVDDSLKQSMEQAFNQGNNGKNLYKHILTCSTQDGCNSSQVSADSKLKFQAFQQVYEYTGLKLNELKERGGTYYTKEGEDIKELVSAAVDKSNTVPGNYKAQVKQWICGMISEISGKGWNNVADMKLSILFQSGRLIDTKQSIVYETEIDVRLADVGETLQGRVYIHLDLSNVDEPIKILAQAAAELPPLDADVNINYNNSSYDLELAIFTVSSAGLEGLTKVFPTLKAGSGGGGGGETLTRATSYAVGDAVTAVGAPGWATLVCTQAGTTAALEPSGYSRITKVGDKVLDGTAVFTARNIIGELDGVISSTESLGESMTDLDRKVAEMMSSTGLVVTRHFIVDGKSILFSTV